VIPKEFHVPTHTTAGNQSWRPISPDLTCCWRGTVLATQIEQLIRVADEITTVRTHVHDTQSNATGSAARYLHAEITSLDKALEAFDAVIRPLRGARHHAGHLCDLREEAGAPHT
jgi:hypothetical protein